MIWHVSRGVVLVDLYQWMPAHTQKGGLAQGRGWGDKIEAHLGGGEGDGKDKRSHKRGRALGHLSMCVCVCGGGRHVRVRMTERHDMVEKANRRSQRATIGRESGEGACGRA